MSSSSTVKNSSHKSAEITPSDRELLAPSLDEHHVLDVVRPFLEQVVGSTDQNARRASDPVGLVHEYDDPGDREVAAIICSSLAYGRVDLLRRAASEVLSVLGPSPRTRLFELTDAELADGLADFVYRMTRGPDVVDLLVAIRSTLDEHGSLEACYASTKGDHLTRAAHFVDELRARRRRKDVARGFRYLLPNPSDGSATKRLHMFFRWVGRGPDEVDFGLWDSLAPRDLVMPLDTHTSRICRYVGLLERASTDLKAARQVTAALRMMRPEDPLYYDFALAHLGISGRCIHRRSAEHCPGCPLEPICAL